MPNKAWRGAINQHLENQQEPLKEAIKEVVCIPSVIDEEGGGFPFGTAVDDVLRKTLEIAEGLGFRTKYGDEGYYGYAEVGECDEMIAVLGHLDVVPAGTPDAWETDPFDPVEKDGRIFGRGTQDDKGPTLAALFAAKALMDAGVTFNKRLRFIFGTDEETLWRGVKRYLEREERPSMGFAPDSKFPMIYAEKGLLEFYLEANNESGLNLAGGCAFNAVPDSIVYGGERQEELVVTLDRLGYSYELDNGSIKVVGKAVHASVAEKGTNAIARLAIALDGAGVESKAVSFVAREVGEDPFATKIFGQCWDQPLHKLEKTLGTIQRGQN